MKMRKWMPICVFLQFFRDTSLPIWGCLAVVSILSVWIQAIPPDSGLAKHLASEVGFFEQSSAAFLIAASLLAMLSSIVDRSRTWLAAGIVLLYAALRELDFQTMFTYRSVMSTGYYASGRAGLGEKILVLLFILPCLLAICNLAYAAWKHKIFLPRVSSLESKRQGVLGAWGVWMLLFFVMSHLSDRHPGLLAWFPGRVGAWEALVEAGLCLLVLLLVIELKPCLLKRSDS